MESLRRQTRERRSVRRKIDVQKQLSASRELREMELGELGPSHDEKLEERLEMRSVHR